MNNEDRELLEMAAKAAEYDIGYDGDFYVMGHLATWNPLTDDGDALRLAVKLRLKIICNPSTVEVSAAGFCRIAEPHNQDPYSATRRAIVRAAAEIGKTLK